jgi:hypothetical protein
MKLRTSMLLTVIALSSFIGDFKIFETGKWIPAEFDTRKTTLLVENFKLNGGNKHVAEACEKVTNDMKAVMKERYPYKYEFVSYDDLQGAGKYADKDAYRFVIMFDHDDKMNSSGGSYAANVFHLYDRKLNKHYPETSKTSGMVIPVFAPTVSAVTSYLKALKN